MRLRHLLDDYPTPASAIDPILQRIPWQTEGPILEPCAGSGQICAAMKHRWPDRLLWAVEINPRYADPLRAVADAVIIDDFCAWADRMAGSFTPGLIVTNPPYQGAEEILEACFKLAGSTTQIVMLLRLSFLESRQRKPFWDRHPLTALYALSKRPSFTGDGKTYGQGFGWFVWGPGERGIWVV